MRRQIAIIGAGISGLTAAQHLLQAGYDLTIFEKSRGVGGRMATRRDRDGLTFDHGAQYFTARDPDFQAIVERWENQQWVATWPLQGFAICRQGQFAVETAPPRRYVGTPGMTSIAKSINAELLEKNVSIHLNVRIARVTGRGHDFELINEQGELITGFAGVLLAIPAEQAADLLDADRADTNESDAAFARTLRAQAMHPCLATMAVLENDLPVDWEGCFIHDSFIRWAARNHTKPGRFPSPATLVLHAAPDWTAQHWDDPPAEIATEMLAEFWRTTGIAAIRSPSCSAHRWKYSIPAGAPDLVNDPSTPSATLAGSSPADNPPHAAASPTWPWQHRDLPIVACGDWTMAGRIEGAYRSGVAAASALAARLG